MKSNNSEERKPAINTLLIVIALFIIGGLGLIILTQIEVIPGYVYTQDRSARPTQVEIASADGGLGVIAYTKITDLDPDNVAVNNSPHFGSLAYFGRYVAIPSWYKELNGPVQKVFPIMDANNDNIQDYLVCYATAYSDYYLDYGRWKVNLTDHMYGVQLLSGKTGNFIALATGDNANYTHEEILDVEYFTDTTDDAEDFICIWIDDENTLTNVSGYFLNGSIKQTLNFSFSKCIGIDLFPIGGETHLLAVGYNHSITKSFFTIRNMSNYAQELYTTIIDDEVTNFAAINDLNGDSIPEYILAYNTGKLTLINGSNGIALHNSTKFENPSWNLNDLEVIYEDSTGFADVIINFWVASEIRNTTSVRITPTQFTMKWTTVKTTYFEGIMLLDTDVDNDGYPDLIIHEKAVGIGSAQEINRYIITSGNTMGQIGIINHNAGPSSGDNFVSIVDIDNDGKKDWSVSTYEGFIIFSSNKPIGMWFNTTIPWGFALFIACIGMLVFGGILLIYRFKRGEMKFEVKKGLKQNKLSIIVCTVVIALMIMVLLLFSMTMNVFDSTLLLNDENSNVIMAFITTNLLWFACLPVTGALYNISAAKSSYLFVKLRQAMFKLSRNVDHEIIVIKMDPDLKLGMVNSLRRCILPILLSITVGLFIYNTFAIMLGFPTSFTNFGGTDFMKFMSGYMLLGMIPMVMSFFIFFFLIPASWLLDDAGVAYYVSNNKQDHIPGDIERMSVWQTSFITGFASFSSLITFYNFMIGIDLSGFFMMENVLMGIMGALIAIVAFWGLPFLTGFAFMLLAIGVMEGTLPENREKLYKIMKNGGYDITPRNITQLYPDGYNNKKTIKNSEVPLGP